MILFLLLLVTPLVFAANLNFCAVFSTYEEVNGTKQWMGDHLVVNPGGGVRKRPSWAGFSQMDGMGREIMSSSLYTWHMEISELVQSIMGLYEKLDGEQNVKISSIGVSHLTNNNVKYHVSISKSSNEGEILVFNRSENLSLEGQENLLQEAISSLAHNIEKAKEMEDILRNFGFKFGPLLTGSELLKKKVQDLANEIRAFALERRIIFNQNISAGNPVTKKLVEELQEQQQRIKKFMKANQLCDDDQYLLGSLLDDLKNDIDRGMQALKSEVADTPLEESSNEFLRSVENLINSGRNGPLSEEESCEMAREYLLSVLNLAGDVLNQANPSQASARNRNAPPEQCSIQ